VGRWLGAVAAAPPLFGRGGEQSRARQSRAERPTPLLLVLSSEAARRESERRRAPEILSPVRAPVRACSLEDQTSAARGERETDGRERKKAAIEGGEEEEPFGRKKRSTSKERGRKLYQLLSFSLCRSRSPWRQKGRAVGRPSRYYVRSGWLARRMRRRGKRGFHSRLKWGEKEFFPNYRVVPDLA